MFTRMDLRVHITAAALLAVLTGCGESFVEIQVDLLTRACEGATGQRPDTLANASHIEFTLTGEGIDPPITDVVAVDAGSANLTGIPIATDGLPAVERRLEVKARFNGETGPVLAVGGAVFTMTADDPGPHKVPVFLKPIDSYVNSTDVASPDTCTLMQRARSGHTATLLPSGKVLIAGGAEYDAAGGRKVHDSVEIFDPSTGQFDLRVSGSGGLLQPRVNHTATLTKTAGEGNVVLLAGGEFDVPGGTKDALKPAEVFDPEADAFQAPVISNQARSRHTATLLDGQFVLLAGGTADPGAAPTDRQPLVSSEAFDVLTNRFIPGPNLPEAKSDHCATQFRDGAVAVLAGGTTLDGVDVVAASSVFFFRITPQGVPELLTEGTGVPLVADLGTARYDLSCTSIGPSGETVIMGGGFTTVGLFDDTSAFSGIERFDVTKTPRLAEIGQLSSARGKACALATDSGTVMFIGGQNRNDVTVSGATDRLTRDDTGVYAMAQSAGLPMNTRRFSHTCTMLQDGSVLVAGGRSPDATGQNFPSTATAEIYTPLFKE